MQELEGLGRGRELLLLRVRHNFPFYTMIFVFFLSSEYYTGNAISIVTTKRFGYVEVIVSGGFKYDSAKSLTISKTGENIHTVFCCIQMLGFCKRHRAVFSPVNVTSEFSKCLSFLPSEASDILHTS